MAELQSETLNVYCTNCHYLLRGLGPAGVCPECGKPIAHTLAEREIWRRRLANSPPPKPPAVHPPLSSCPRRRLRRITAGTLLLVFAYLGIGAWALLRGATHVTPFDGEYLLTTVCCIHCLAVLLIAFPDREVRRSIRGSVSSIVLCLCAISGVVASVFAILGANTPTVYGHDAWDGWSSFFALALAPGTCLLFVHLAFIMSGASESIIGRFAYIPALLASEGAFRLWMVWPTHFEGPMSPTWKWIVATTCYVFPLMTLIYIAMVLVKECRSGPAHKTGDDVSTLTPKPTSVNMQ